MLTIGAGVAIALSVAMHVARNLLARPQLKDAYPLWWVHGETDEEGRASFHKVFKQIQKRMEAFVALPIESMDADAIRQAAN